MLARFVVLPAYYIKRTARRRSAYDCSSQTMPMNLTKLRVLGSGYTDEEYDLYRLESIVNPDDVTRFLSNRLNNEIFRPRVNNSALKHLIEDKWVCQLYFSALGLPLPKTLGVYHPQVGMTTTGRPFRSPDDVRRALGGGEFRRLALKPRGGRQGRNIIVADFKQDSTGALNVSTSSGQRTLDEFLLSLPSDAFKDYDGGYHGWLVHEYIEQHQFMLELNPHTVNTFRIITFIGADGECKIHLAALRLGRKGSSADNWDKGGLAVRVDRSPAHSETECSNPRMAVPGCRITRTQMQYWRVEWFRNGTPLSIPARQRHLPFPRSARSVGTSHSARTVQ